MKSRTRPKAARDGARERGNGPRAVAHLEVRRVRAVHRGLGDHDARRGGGGGEDPRGVRAGIVRCPFSFQRARGSGTRVSDARSDPSRAVAVEIDETRGEGRFRAVARALRRSRPSARACNAARRLGVLGGVCIWMTCSKSYKPRSTSADCLLVAPYPLVHIRRDSAEIFCRRFFVGYFSPPPPSSYSYSYAFSVRIGRSYVVRNFVLLPPDFTSAALLHTSHKP